MRKIVWVALAILVTWIGATGAQAVTYSGSLNYNPPPDSDPLHVSGGTGTVFDEPTTGWEGGPATVAWLVSNDAPLLGTFAWKYTYFIQAYVKDIEKVLLETSPSFGLAQIEDVKGASSYDVGTYSGNFGQPEALYGLEFTGQTDGDALTTWTIQFYSNRSPIWGDIYALGAPSNDGTQNYLNNLGFTLNDNDPPPDPGAVDTSGHFFHHVLVPDTGEDPGPVIPEPSVMIGLAGMGLMGLGAVLLRRKRSA